MLKKAYLGIIVLVLVLLAGLPANAVSREALNDEDCAFTSTVVIRLDGDPEEYTLSKDGEVVKASSPEAAQTSMEDGCRSTGPIEISPLAWPNGWKEFTPSNPYFNAFDGNGTFYAQSSSTSLAWGFYVSKPLYQIATGNAYFTATRSPNGVSGNHCHYSKTQSPAYTFHSSCSGHSYGTQYSLFGAVVFPVMVGTQPGTATINWVLTYRILSWG